MGERVTIEALVRHLIAEHEIAPISSNSEDTLATAEAHFQEVQRKRLLN